MYCKCTVIVIFHCPCILLHVSVKLLLVFLLNFESFESVTVKENHERVNNHMAHEIAR